MSYTYPQAYKCVKCDHEFEYTPDAPHPAPVLQQQMQGDRGIFTRHMPVCPQCWAKFLLENIGLGFCAVKWQPEGSDYEIEKEKSKCEKR